MKQGKYIVNSNSFCLDGLCWPCFPFTDILKLHKWNRPHIYRTYVCFGSFHIFASSLCATVHRKYLPYFGNYIKMKAIFVAISLHCFLLSFISAESINKNVFSFQQLILKTLIFKKTCKRICSPDDLLKEDKWGVKKYFSAYYHELKREICQLVYVSRNTREF